MYKYMQGVKGFIVIYYLAQNSASVIHYYFKIKSVIHYETKKLCMFFTITCKP